MRKIILLSLLSFAFIGRVEAATIGTVTFDGDLWTLDQIDATTFQLTVDTDGSDSQNYIYATAINLGGNSTGGSLAGETAPGTWMYVDGGTNSGGCSGSGAAFDCAQWTSGALAFDDGSVYSWTWTILNPAIDADEDHLKAVYWDSNGTVTLDDDEFAGLQISTGFIDDDDNEVTEVPEPATMLLVGGGLLAAVRRRRTKR